MGHAQPPFEESFPSSFLDGEHGNDFCRHADGALCARFSYAKCHVQDRMLRMYAEAARQGVEGVVLLTIRGGPFVMWKGTPYAHVMVPTTRAPK